jgi:hypothetical protein
MPSGTHLRIKTVQIFFNSNCIFGFKFLAKDSTLLWKIGYTTATSCGIETIELEDNEVIIGVNAKLFPNKQAAYTDFQFIVGRE